MSTIPYKRIAGCLAVCWGAALVLGVAEHFAWAGYEDCFSTDVFYLNRPCASESRLMIIKILGFGVMLFLLASAVLPALIISRQEPIKRESILGSEE
jgi:hypothetical protein